VFIFLSGWKACIENFEVGVKKVIKKYVNIIVQKDIFPVFITYEVCEFKN